MWRDLAPPLGDHLWQSTVFALAAALLTLILRKNHARARYWLWMAASIKFLVPFSWFVALGSHMVWLRPGAPADSGLYLTMEEVTRPFTQSAVSAMASAPAVVSSLRHWLPAIVGGVWLCGFFVVMLSWCLSWRKVTAAIRGAQPIREGREVEALRRAEHVTGIQQRVEMFLSRATLEPGIFGMARPVLVWPEGISERLENPHLEAILAHELVHVRRRDNLGAAIHMAVEAIFWFHPLVWWLGARLVDERERACDEQVLELGSERQVYAESILKVCEFCVGSPLACVSGVTGADLKKRMVHIMSEHVVRKLDFSRKLLLSAVAVAVIAAPIAFGLFHATPSRAQSQSGDAAALVPDIVSASIKLSQAPTPSPGSKAMAKMMYSPDGFEATNVPLRELIQEAYGVQANQIIGPSEFLDSPKYDVNVKFGNSGMNKVDLEQNMRPVRQGLQRLLAERSQLVLHHESKELASYALVVGEDGSKLQPVADRNGSTTDQDVQLVRSGGMRMQMGANHVFFAAAQGVSSAQIAKQLSMQLGAPVIDKTGLKGSYAFNLNWSDAKSENTSAPSLFTALEDQLGLKLEPQKGPIDVLVIDHIEQPTEN
jgi:uncharacterized protein (TIGR03435 family)